MNTTTFVRVWHWGKLKLMQAFWLSLVVLLVVGSYKLYDHFYGAREMPSPDDGCYTSTCATGNP